MHLPYQSLFFGRGDSLDRAWIFTLLCRQQDLDAVILALPGSPAPRPWAVGVLIGEDVYPFDPTLGLPFPGPSGKTASLAQLAADDALLRQLDLDGQHRYPLQASDLKDLIALVEASPGYLSRRMKVLESKLTGEQKIVLTARPSEIVARIKKQSQIGEARLWGVPYERLLAQFSPQARALLEREILPYRFDLLPPNYQLPAADLQRGRILHLKGILAANEGEPSANKFYQRARLADREIDVPALSDTQRMILHRAKEDASYWLGLVAYERRRYETAIDHFEKRTINMDKTSADRGSRWQAGARYNLGRCYEALGRIDEAISQYELTTDNQRHGNLLRARWLKSGAKLSPAD